MNIRGRKIKILLLAVLVCGVLLIIFSGSIGNFIEERTFISKYSGQKDFWLVYPTLKENKELIKKNPKNHSAYDSLGQGYYGLKAYDKAIDAFLRAIEIAPDNPDYWAFLGKVYQAKKDYSKACDSYLAVLKLNRRRSAISNLPGFIISGWMRKKTRHLMY